MGRLDGKVAIVTGGAQGIGGATARRLAEEGAKVLIADIDEVMAEKNAEGIRAAGNEADAVRVDVSKHSDIKIMVEVAVEKWGRLDILFSNAFDVLTAGSGGAVEVSEEDWDSQMAVLLKAIFLGVKYAVPEMRKVGGGSIVNVSSVHGCSALPAFWSTRRQSMLSLGRPGRWRPSTARTAFGSTPCFPDTCSPSAFASTCGKTIPQAWSSSRTSIP